MKKVIRLTESQLTNIIKKVIAEQLHEQPSMDAFKDEFTRKADMEKFRREADATARSLRDKIDSVTATKPSPMACLKPLMEKGKQLLSSCFEKNDIVGTNIPKVMACVAQKIKTTNDPAIKAEWEKAKKCITNGGGVIMDKDKWPQF